MSGSDDSTTATPAKSGGLFDDLLEIFTSPAAVFDRSRQRSPWGYALVMALLTLVLVYATKNLVMPWMDAQTDVAIKIAAAKGKPIPEAAVGQMRRFSEWGLIIGAPVAALAGPFISAIFLWFGAKLAKASLGYRQAAFVAALAGVPKVLALLVMAALALVLPAADARGMADLALGASRFVDPVTTSPVLLGLLGLIDVFRLWELALTAIGIAAVARVSRGTGWAVALIGLACGAILQLIPAALF